MFAYQQAWYFIPEKGFEKDRIILKLLSQVIGFFFVLVYIRRLEKCDSKLHLTNGGYCLIQNLHVKKIKSVLLTKGPRQGIYSFL